MLPYAEGLKPKNEELSVQGRRWVMVKADRSERQHKAEKWFLRRANAVGRDEGSKIPCFRISRTGEKTVRSE